MTGRTLGGPTFDRAGATADLQMIDGGVTSIKLISVLAPRASQRGGTTRRRSPTGATDAIAGCRLSGGSADRDADRDGWLHVGIRKRRGATGASTAVHHRPVPGLTPEPFPELHPRTRIGSLIRSRIPGLGQDPLHRLDALRHRWRSASGPPPGHGQDGRLGRAGRRLSDRRLRPISTVECPWAAAIAPSTRRRISARSAVGGQRRQVPPGPAGARSRPRRPRRSPQLGRGLGPGAVQDAQVEGDPT